MELFIFDSLHKKRVIFKPIDKDEVKIYVCGPTVYDDPHLGNARSIVIYDVLFRIMQHIYGQHSVKYVRNITDIDDKIIERAKQLGISIGELTMQTTKNFHQDTEYLGCLSPTIEPKATDNLPQMIAIIEKLITAGFAYIENGDVYFEVVKSKDYFKLSNRLLQDAQIGNRIQNNSAKINPEDFVLWKSIDSADATYDSPWGKGRPGWHIECSAMSHRYLGENFDIHGGGADLIFPHHTNEIAQSTAAFPGSKFANYWVHNGFLTVEGKKMSKSLGNFITVKDLREKGVHGEVLRLLLLSTHYRKPLDYNNKALADAKKMLEFWHKVIDGVETNAFVAQDSRLFIQEVLLDDLNTPLAIKKINDLAKMAHNANDLVEKSKYVNQLVTNAQFLGFFQKQLHSSKVQDDVEAISNDIQNIIEARIIAKREKNWLKADSLREQARILGVSLIDKADGTIAWQKIDEL